MSKNLCLKHRFFALFRRACCYGASGEKPRALAAALRASDLQVCPHTTLSPYKKPVLTCVNTGLTCMLCGARSSRALHLHVMWSFQPALALAPRGSHPRPPAPCLRPALMRSARRRPWRHAQRTAAPARERSHQRPEPHGRCARPHQDGFRRRSEALQSHRPSRHNRRSCAQG